MVALNPHSIYLTKVHHPPFHYCKTKCFYLKIKYNGFIVNLRRVCVPNESLLILHECLVFSSNLVDVKVAVRIYKLLHGAVLARDRHHPRQVLEPLRSVHLYLPQPAMRMADLEHTGVRAFMCLKEHITVLLGYQL